MTNKIRCTAPGCDGGTTIGSGLSFGICAICGGSGWVTRRERVQRNSSTECPYGACGGRCGGKGYYLYKNEVRIDCSLNADI